MSTNSIIAKLEPDGKITSVYCHWDGYPSNNGKILLEHYNEEAIVDDLLAGGNLSSLGKVIGEQHVDDSDNRHKYKDMCTYYGRDRNEDDMEPCSYDNLAEFLTDERNAYMYLWTADGWKFAIEDGPLEPLTPEACEKYKR